VMIKDFPSSLIPPAVTARAASVENS